MRRSRGLVVLCRPLRGVLLLCLHSCIIETKKLTAAQQIQLCLKELYVTQCPTRQVCCYGDQHQIRTVCCWVQQRQATSTEVPNVSLLQVVSYERPTLSKAYLFPESKGAYCSKQIFYRLE